MKETPIFSASNSFTTNVNRNYTLKQNVDISYFGDLVLENSDLTGITNKAQMADWIKEHLKVTVTPSIPMTSDSMTYVKGNVSASISNVTTAIDASTDVLSIQMDINFTYTIMVYHDATLGVDVAVPEVTIPFIAFGVLTE